MDLLALARNFKKSAIFCPRLIDRIKYILWLYNYSDKFGKGKPWVIQFVLPQPAGELTLAVRCNHGSDAFIFSEIFERQYYDFNLTQVPATILDLGANIGFTALFFSRKYPCAEIVCVEPMPENVALLLKNISNQKVPVKVMAKAIAAEDGTITMQRAAMDYGHKVNAIDFGKKLNGETIQVSGISVPTLMNELLRHA